MTVPTFNWRILKTLSNWAIYVNIVIWLLDWYHWSWLDESVMNNRTVGDAWLRREHLYVRIGLVSVALVITLRVTYWIIEYIHERRMVASDRGDG
jgi:hypothetical protein